MKMQIVTKKKLWGKTAIFLRVLLASIYLLNVGMMDYLLFSKNDNIKPKKKKPTANETAVNGK